MDDVNNCEVPTTSYSDDVLPRPNEREAVPPREGHDETCSGQDSRNVLSFGFLNICHIYPKLDQLQSILCDESSQFDVFALNETWLNKSYDNCELKIPGFKLIRKDRLEGKGGGVAFYVDDNIPYEKHPEFEFDKIEAVWIEIILPRTNVLVCALYRPPNKPADWFGDFKQMMEKPSKNFEDIVIVGDFNIGEETKNWKAICSQFKLSQMVKEITREETRGGTESKKTIDHIYTTNDKRVSNVRVPRIQLSDHYPLYFRWQFDDPEAKWRCHQSMKYCPIDRIDMRLFRRELDICEWDHVLKEEDPDKALEQFKFIFKRVLNKHAPYEDKVVNKKCQPLHFNDKIRKAIAFRDSNIRSKRI